MQSQGSYLSKHAKIYINDKNNNKQIMTQYELKLDDRKRMIYNTCIFIFINF